MNALGDRSGAAPSTGGSPGDVEGDAEGGVKGAADAEVEVEAEVAAPEPRASARRRSPLIATLTSALVLATVLWSLLEPEARVGVDARRDVAALYPAAAPASPSPSASPSAPPRERLAPRLLSAAELAEAGAWIEIDAADPVGDATRSETDTEQAADLAPGELGALPDDHLVLQVLVSSTAERALRFIDAREDAPDYRYYVREREGARQYVVVEGDYASAQDAARAVSVVAEATGQRPFPRSVAQVKAELSDG